jgi:anti-sigma factor RsiW
MECSEIRLKLDEYIRGNLNPSEAEMIRLHISKCAVCAEELGILREINEMLNVENSAEPPVDFTANVMKAVEAYRDRTGSWFFKRAPLLNLGASLLLTGIFILLLNMPVINQTINSYAGSIKDEATVLSSNISATTSEIQSYFQNILSNGGK